jgi:surface antigen/plastocyanin
MNKGVGISNKSVTSRRLQVSQRLKAVSDMRNSEKSRRKISRYVKIGIVSVALLGLAGGQLVGRVASEARYVAPQARLENPIQPVTAHPVDEVVAAEVAAVAAEQADLLITPNVANRADTLDAQVSMATTTEQTTTSVVQKPQFVAPSNKTVEDIITITVGAGDTVESLAQKYSISADTIRWANSLVTDTLAVGSQLKILPVTGVLYTVQSGDTAESLAATYQTSAEQIIAFNDVEVNGLNPGVQIIIPNGTKPAARATTYSSSSSSSLSSAGFSFGGGVVYAGNRYAYGYCTWYAYNKRAAAGRVIGSNWGNATTWAALASASGFSVDKAPRAGDVFQTSGGWGGYGHVGYVEAVNGDGSILVSEMNYAGWNRISSRTIPADQVGLYNYIH